MPVVRKFMKSMIRELIGLVFLVGIVATPSAYSAPDTTLTIKDHKISVEIADTNEAREIGLMFRKHLENSHGMLFIFEEPEYEAMWMENTYIPLSVAFINDKGVIVNIENMAPLTRELHESDTQVLYALEMNVDWFKKHGIKAGDKILGLLQNSRTNQKRSH